MNSELKNLIGKYLQNGLTPGETARLQQMLQDSQHLDSLEEMILAHLQETRPEEPGDEAMRSTILAGLDRKIDSHESSHNITVIPLRQRLAGNWKMLAAASVLLFVLTGAWFRFHHAASAPAQLVSKPAPAKKIVPGSNKATLTLADGSEITLDDTNKGDIAVQGGIRVVKTDNGVIAYNGKNANSANMFNTIRTPRGGQYEVVLPDGTHAWLNSASSLRYPASFSGPRREVTLDGQGYFDVAPNKDHPFVVHTSRTDVNVLGTSFDVMAYADEPETNTTLIAGSVIVNHAGKKQQLNPGEQAHLDLASESMTVRKPDVEEVIAWVNGKFQFGSSDIRSIMRQISRWYDVEVEYRGDLSDLHLSGVLSRKDDVSVLLDALQETGDVRFKMENNKIIVTPVTTK